MDYRPYIANHGGHLAEVNSHPDFSLDINAIQAALWPKTQAVFINSPHNPTGRVYSAESIAASRPAFLKAASDWKQTG